MANTVSRILSDETLNRIIQIESAGNPIAQARTSSAAGLGQFIKGTWLATVQKHKPSLLKTNSREQVTAMRVGVATAALQLEMLARFTEDNRAAIGAGCTDGDLYLAHFLGLGDARKLFRAPPNDPAPHHVSEAAVEANTSILSGKTCGQVRAWAQASMEQRWIKAGKPDWVRKYAGGAVALPPPPDVPKPSAPPANKPGVGRTAAGAGAVIVATGGGVVIATESAKKGASTTEIAIIVGCTLLIAAAAFFLIRHWRRS